MVLEIPIIVLNDGINKNILNCYYQYLINTKAYILCIKYHITHYRSLHIETN